MLLSVFFHQTQAQPQRAHDPRMDWFEEAKFGLFIHWGVNAIWEGVYHGEETPRYAEWIMHNSRIPIPEYREVAKDFYPDQYDPEYWVKLAKEAGMKYLVITTKHHDGFALFDSQYSDWNAVQATKWGKDLIKPLADACQREGIKLGFYYSHSLDWVNGGYVKQHWDPEHAAPISFDEYLQQVAYPQVTELLENYGAVDIMWWDMPKAMSVERTQPFKTLLEEQYPQIIQNTRLGNRKMGAFCGDFETPEQNIPEFVQLDKYWESCMTMNHNWSYRKSDQDWKSLKDLLINLTQSVSKGGNYLLNIGPKPDGSIPQASIERLEGFADWMSVNAEAIHGSSHTPFKHLPFYGTCTQKDNILYFHIYDWPGDQKLLIPGLKNEISRAYLLADDQQALHWEKTALGPELQLPFHATDPNVSVLAVEVAGELQIAEVDVEELQAGNLYSAQKAKIAGQQYFDAKTKLVQNWKNKGESLSWEVDIRQPGLYRLSSLVDFPKKSGDYHFSLEFDGKLLQLQYPSRERGQVHSTVFKMGSVAFESAGRYTMKMTLLEDQEMPFAFKKIQLDPLTLSQNSDAQVVLLAKEAILEKGLWVQHNSYLGGWSAEGSASWPFLITEQSGEFDLWISLRNSIPQAITVWVNQEAYSFQVPATTNGLQQLKVGRINVPESGQNQLKVQVSEVDKASALNIEKIILK
ncbi:hypothetical protein PEDI_11950 [Persicobacter diffluens]|uniref:alpha-L-fucosidase n=1 Tax=Persicobacter diffluens TaxID=981 RepID=A0AAN5AL97_9BACT|nr:hypothetical protein PEDI_11950 [Persicobacter diffluens]